MSVKSFIFGVVTGIALSIGGLYILGRTGEIGEDNIQYLDEPLSYEKKTETSFEVFQVLEDAALAREVSNKSLELYVGNTVLIEGEFFYNNQIITIKNPQRIGTYSYTTKSGRSMTVPIINGEKIE